MWGCLGGHLRPAWIAGSLAFSPRTCKPHWLGIKSHGTYGLFATVFQRRLGSQQTQKYFFHLSRILQNRIFYRFWDVLGAQWRTLFAGSHPRWPDGWYSILMVILWRSRNQASEMLGGFFTGILHVLCGPTFATTSMSGLGAFETAVTEKSPMRTPWHVVNYHMYNCIIIIL